MNFKWFDSHCHPHDVSYVVSSDEIIFRAQTEGVAMCLIGTDFATSRQAVELAGKHQGCYATVGQHPDTVFFKDGEAKLTEDFDDRAYEFLIQSQNIVAMGECGLDYFRLPPEAEAAALVKLKQMELFVAQLEFAADRELPVVIHCREAYADLLALRQKKPELFVHGAVVHCFTGNVSEAESLTAAGFYLGLTGIVTFPKAEELKKVAKIIPAEQLLIETDCPYLAPVPYRGETNYPQYIVQVGEYVAELRGMTSEALAELTRKNAERLFHLPNLAEQF